MPRSARGGSRAHWKRLSRHGACAMCGKRGPVQAHHVVYAQHVRVEGGDQWDVRNAMPLGVRCRCHANHHARINVIPLRLIPDAALDFAVELMGEDRAAYYLARYYDATNHQED